jgi:hypothetical protein
LKKWLTSYVQDLIIKTHNIEYSIPRFYDRHAKKTFPIDLPAGVKGHFGGTLRTFALFSHHTGRVTEKNLKIFLTEMGCQISWPDPQNTYRKK